MSLTRAPRAAIKKSGGADKVPGKRESEGYISISDPGLPVAAPAAAGKRGPPVAAKDDDPQVVDAMGGPLGIAAFVGAEP